MRKISILLVAVLCAVMLFGCAPAVPEPAETTQPTTEPATEPTTEPTTAPTSPGIADYIPTGLEYVPGSIELEDRDQDDYDFARKYRVTYYRIWGEFFDLLTEEQLQDFYAWEDEWPDGEDREKMLLAEVVQRYNIPREEFDKAVVKFVEHNLKANCGMTVEEYEVPNADVIYTFDDEIINHYYRYA